MIVEGDLKYVNLANLVEMICLEKRKAMLQLKQAQQEGIIYFLRGEILHAACGAVVGEDAVYQLLSWLEGTYQLEEYDQAPTRTVTAPWNELLAADHHQPTEDQSNTEDLEEVTTEDLTTKQEPQLPDSLWADQDNQLDQPDLNETNGPPISKAILSHDRRLENDLIRLLSKLEHLQSRLSNRKKAQRFEFTLPVLTDFVNQVIQCAEKWLSRNKKVETLTKAMDQVGRTNLAIRALSAKKNRLNSRDVVSLHHRWINEGVDSSQAMHLFSEGMLVIIETHYLLLVACFHSSSKADKWRETFEHFFYQVEKMVERVD